MEQQSDPRIIRLVDRLIAETRTSKPGTSASDKLRDTAVKVLTGRHAAQARSWQKVRSAGWHRPFPRKHEGLGLLKHTAKVLRLLIALISTCRP